MPQVLNQLVEAAEKVHNRHQLRDALVVQAQLLRRRSVDVYSIVTTVHRGDGHGDDFFSQVVQFPRLYRH